MIARTQTAGRGRGGKKWWSGDGALLMSLGSEIGTFQLTRNELPLLSVSVARTVLEILRERIPNRRPNGHEVRLRSPNDIYVDGRKISGILLESPTPRHVVIGIGINVNNRLVDIPTEFREHFENRPITSLIELTGMETDHAELVEALLRRLLDTNTGRYARGGAASCQKNL